MYVHYVWGPIYLVYNGAIIVCQVVVLGCRVLYVVINWYMIFRLFVNMCMSSVGRGRWRAVPEGGRASQARKQIL